jgi:UDPglucose 6-dehydrogenase
MVAKALGLDSRIGPKFLRSGIGYGGGCFTKDVLALAHRAEELGASSLAEMLRATDSANTNARRRALDLVLKNLPNDPCKVAFLGAAFKPGSDDVRDSPAVWLVKKLQETRKDLTISWFDPAFKEGFELADISMSRSAQNAVAGAALTVIATDWSDFRSMSPENLSPANKVLIDVRICVSVEKWTSLGWEVHQLGRPSRLPFSQTPAC